MAILLWHGSKGTMDLGHNASKKSKLEKKTDKKKRMALLKSQGEMMGVKRFSWA